MNDDMNYPTADADHAAGVAAVWQVADEAGPTPAGDRPDEAMLADVRQVDAALRALAVSEAPDAIELRRMRDAAIRTTRLHAVEAMNRKTLSPPPRRRSVPKWSIGLAAAAVVAVGFFTWVANSAPSAPRTMARVTGNEVEDRRAAFMTEIQDYAPLVSAFTPVELPSDASADNLEDLGTQVDALALLGGEVADVSQPADAGESTDDN